MNITIALPPTTIPPQSPAAISESTTLTHLQLTTTYSRHLKSGPDGEVIQITTTTSTSSIVSTSISKSKHQQTEMVLITVLISLLGILICCCFLFLIACSRSKSKKSSTPALSIGNINKTSPVRQVGKTDSPESISQECTNSCNTSSKHQLTVST